MQTSYFQAVTQSKNLLLRIRNGRYQNKHPVLRRALPVLAKIVADNGGDHDNEHYIRAINCTALDAFEKARNLQVYAPRRVPRCADNWQVSV